MDPSRHPDVQTRDTKPLGMDSTFSSSPRFGVIRAQKNFMWGHSFLLLTLQGLELLLETKL